MRAPPSLQVTIANFSQELVLDDDDDGVHVDGLLSLMHCLPMWLAPEKRIAVEDRIRASARRSNAEMRERQSMRVLPELGRGRSVKLRWSSPIWKDSGRRSRGERSKAENGMDGWFRLCVGGGGERVGDTEKRKERERVDDDDDASGGMFPIGDIDPFTLPLLILASSIDKQLVLDPEYSGSPFLATDNISGQLHIGNPNTFVNLP